jgi:hypothetical protein
VTDLVALAEVLPADEARRLHDLGTTAALSSWADAFIDRVHAPACVDSVTGLATLAYLRVRLEEVYRDGRARSIPAGEEHALVVVSLPPRSASPFARLAARIDGSRAVRTRFPGGETAAAVEPDLVLVLAPRDEALGRRVQRLDADLAAIRSLRPTPPRARCRIEPLAPRLRDTHASVDRIIALCTPSPGVAS